MEFVESSWLNVNEIVQQNENSTQITRTMTLM